MCFEGESGLLACCPIEILKGASIDKAYNKSLAELHFANGSLVQGFSAEEPERLRGPQFHDFWADELAAWTKEQETWDMLMFALRLGKFPRGVVTTTPKPKPLVRELLRSPRTIISSGSSYENRANISPKVYERLAKYEGTKLGRQEIHGEVIDLEEAGIVKRSWIKMWSSKRKLPKFEYVVMSLDTSFSEKAVDKKSHEPDPSACTVWGAFIPSNPPIGLYGQPLTDTYHLMLLDAWEEHLKFPDLVDRVKREAKAEYGQDDAPLIKPLIGPSHLRGSGHKVDLILIEDKGSGISLRQTLARDGIYAAPYNPGKADKLMRLHTISHIFLNGMIWMVESGTNPGLFRDWAEPLVSQLCSYAGEGSIAHDDLMDSATQAIRLFADRGFVIPAEEPRRPDDKQEPIDYHNTPLLRPRDSAKPLINPYAA